MIQFMCPFCDSPVEFEDVLRDQDAPCPACREIITVTAVQGDGDEETPDGLGEPAPVRFPAKTSHRILAGMAPFVIIAAIGMAIALIRDTNPVVMKVFANGGVRVWRLSEMGVFGRFGGPGMDYRQVERQARDARTVRNCFFAGSVAVLALGGGLVFRRLRTR